MTRIIVNYSEEQYFRTIIPTYYRGTIHDLLRKIKSFDFKLVENRNGFSAESNHYLREENHLPQLVISVSYGAEIMNNLCPNAIQLMARGTKEYEFIGHDMLEALIRELYLQEIDFNDRPEIKCNSFNELLELYENKRKERDEFIQAWQGLNKSDHDKNIDYKRKNNGIA